MWGASDSGGDNSAAQGQLRDVQQIQPSAAILGDGSVVTWGHDENGGDSTAVQNQLKTVKSIQATEAAFAAILGDTCV